MHPEFEAVIGLEVHCQLSTQTKIFCACPARAPSGVSVADLVSNAHTCPVCAGHPGALPVLNRKVVEFAILSGLATHCQIRRKSVFARKNYFYPDLPKGYQISQFDLPICEGGFLEIQTSSGRKRITLQRIHMEEDAGKNIHMPGYSLVNLNRAGVPLIEIVSAPDMKTPEEAGAYLRALHAIVTYLEICDGNMQEGNFRCDANVSVMPKGSKTFGTRAEIKNVNSFRFVEKAIEYEIARQIEVIQSGQKVLQETRTFDAQKGVTLSMRSKEEAQDYRYFPDPDLIPVQIQESWIDELRGILPELPEQKKSRYVQSWGLTQYDADILTSSKSLAQFFEKVMERLGKSKESVNTLAKLASNWISGELIRLVNESGQDLAMSRVLPEHLADLVELVHQKTISHTGAKRVLAVIWEAGGTVSEVVEREGLRQVSDASALDPIIYKIIEMHPQQVQEFKSGKEKLLGFFVGQAMKETSGKGNPSLLGDLFKKKLLGD